MAFCPQTPLLKTEPFHLSPALGIKLPGQSGDQLPLRAAVPSTFTLCIRTHGPRLGWLLAWLPLWLEWLNATCPSKRPVMLQSAHPTHSAQRNLVSQSPETWQLSLITPPLGSHRRLPGSVIPHFALPKHPACLLHSSLST